MKLRRKSAVITGGAVGIGKAVAQLFSSKSDSGKWVLE
jgi:NAD(P)-dependent dehydrogenase (short-subunit alcohol dehydrogenase family)